MTETINGLHRCQRFSDLTGKRFGRWTVIRESGRTQQGKTQWLCQCDCGNQGIVRRSNLMARSKSCGCLRRDIGAQLSKQFPEVNTVHGHARRGRPATPIYKSWVNMRQRCYDVNNHAFKYYGGRGISVCARWQKFENFLADMGPKPEGLTIDRINTEGHYMPSNCRWATRAEQSANRNYNRKYA